jgi:hypothetical protein
MLKGKFAEIDLYLKNSEIMRHWSQMQDNNLLIKVRSEQKSGNSALLQ